MSEGKLSCQLTVDFQGAYAWVHSRKENGKTLVSNQMLIFKNMGHRAKQARQDTQSIHAFF